MVTLINADNPTPDFQVAAECLSAVKIDESNNTVSEFTFGRDSKKTLKVSNEPFEGTSDHAIATLSKDNAPKRSTIFLAAPHSRAEDSCMCNTKNLSIPICIEAATKQKSKALVLPSS
jgi:hypothetical protein